MQQSVLSARGEREAFVLDWAGVKLTAFQACYIRVSRNERWILSISDDRIEVRSAANQELVCTVSFGDQSIIAADIDDDARNIFTVGDDETIRQLTCDNRSARVFYPGVRSALDEDLQVEVTGLRFDPDGRILAIASPPVWVMQPMSLMTPGQVSVWELGSRRRLAQLTRAPSPGDHSSDIVQPEFSSDSKRILIESSRYRSIVWEWQSEPAKTLEEDLAGKTMKGNGEIDEAERNFPALGVPNVNVTVIDGELVAEDQFGQRLPSGSRKLQGKISSATISPDGQQLAVADGSGRVMVMQVFRDSSALLAGTKEAMTRCLTQLQRKQYSMSDIPPRWCITGAGREKEPDQAKWVGVWPYDTARYRDWLVAADAAQATTSRLQSLRALVFGAAEVSLPAFPSERP